MNARDLVYLITGRDDLGRPLVAGEDGEAVAFYVQRTDGQNAVIRWPDDEVELTVPVTDLILVDPS